MIKETASSPNWLQCVSPVPSTSRTGQTVTSLCGHTRNHAGWIEPKRVIYDYELVLIERGDYRVHVQDVTFDCPSNTFIIIPPNYWHTSSCLQKGVRHYTHFDWQHVARKPDRPIMTFYPARPQHHHIHPEPEHIPEGILHGSIRSPTIVFDLVKRLSLMLAGVNPHEQLAARGVLLELLIRLLDPQAPITETEHRQEALAHRVRHALNAAMSDMQQPLSIRDLLGTLGHSYEHLARVFRQQYGLTPMNYIQSIRIERAKHLLRQTDMKINTVAREVGYEDSACFSRLFKRVTGLPPGRFRHH